MIGSESQNPTPAQLIPISTLLGAPAGDLEDLTAGTVALAGLYCDHFGGAEPGARLAARQIRYGCSHFARTAWEGCARVGSNIIDIGDLNVFPLEPPKNFSALTDQTVRIAASGARLLAIGGDYSLTPALIAGLKSAGQSPSCVVRISQRLDLASADPQGDAPGRDSSSRVISECLDGGLSSMLFWGCAGRHALAEHELANSTTCVAGRSIEADPEHDLALVREKVLAHSGSVFLSLDTDVLERRHLNSWPRRPTGEVTLLHLIEFLRALHGAEIVGGHLSGFIPRIATTQWDATEGVVAIAREMAGLMQGEAR